MAENPTTPKKRGGGGKQPGAGRPKGAKSNKTKKIIEKVKDRMIAGRVMSPLEVITEAMQTHYDLFKLNQDGGDEGQRFKHLRVAVEYAEKAAPYIHHRLATTTLSNDGDKPFVVQFIDDIQ